jgi:hypothetical protein
MEDASQRSLSTSETGRTGLARLIPQKLRDLFTRKPENLSPDDTPLIHPDIEAGMKYTLDHELVDMVRTGNIPGINIAVKNFSQAWEQAQTASNSTFEPTDSARIELDQKIGKIMVDHVPEGLANIFGLVGFNVSQGMEWGMTTGSDNLNQLFLIAEKFNVPIRYLPPQEDDQEVGNNLLVPVVSLEQAREHMQNVIDRNLPKGLRHIVDMLGFQVSQGQLRQLPEFEQRLERWIDIMKKRGWSTDEELDSQLHKQINLSEVRRQVDEEIKANLATGARWVVKMVGFSVGSGSFDPVHMWSPKETLNLYLEASKKYAPEQPGLDIEELLLQTREEIINNLPKGINIIIDRHLQSVEAGDVSQITFGVNTLEQYIQMANEYGVSINPDQLRKSMNRHITPEKLRLGVDALAEVITTDLRRSDYLGVSVHSRQIEDFRQFIGQSGFARQVDFSKLDKYLNETATQHPQLPS